jgi:hypothetical protein
LLLVDAMVTAECKRQQIERADYRFSRREVRAVTGWGDTQLRLHLGRLEELEYLALHRGVSGQSFVYALNFEMDANGRPVLPGLSYGAKRPRSEDERSGFTEGVSGQDGQRSGQSLGQVWGVSGGGLGEESPAMTRAEGSFSGNNGKRIDKGAEANGVLQTPVVAVPMTKPNGNGNGKMEGNAWPA